MVEYQDMLKALTINYLNVYFIDVEINKGDVLKLEGYNFKDMSKDSRRFTYTDALHNYADVRVHPDDLEEFYANLMPQSLLAEFADGKSQYEHSYRVLENDKVHYYVAHYIRVSEIGKPLTVIAGFRNVDNVIVDEAKKLKEGLYKGYNALSSIYLYMDRVDIKNNTFYEIKSNESISEFVDHNSGNFDGQIQNAIIGLITESYHEDVLVFADIKTLEKRMRGHDSIVCEFLGKEHGWCRMRFIREDEDDNGNLWHVIFAIETIDEDRQRENKFKQLAELDHLTGILNRGTGERQIRALVNQEVDGLFCLIDCDKFKSINDNFGHTAGDKVIIAVARALENAIRKDDILLRLGGDEYAIYAPGIVTENDAMTFWHRIVSEIEQIHISEIKGQKICISLGGAFFKRESHVDFEELYRIADKAMYLSKQSQGHKATFTS